MNELQKNRINAIIGLHNEIRGLLCTSLEKGLRIGELLIEQKAGLKHGDFIRWVKANLPFTPKTAQNYMRLYAERDHLKSENVSHLTAAYRLLADSHREPLIPENWDYDESISRVRGLLSQIVEAKHAIGKDILQDFDKFSEKYGNRWLEDLARDMEQSVGNLRSCIEFAKKFPTIEDFWASESVEQYIDEMVMQGGKL